MFTRYRTLLEGISQFGVHFSPPLRDFFETSDPQCPLLRHDVDFSIFGLESMGAMERDFGHSSIYLFRPDARSYNFESSETLRIIQSLKSMGHEIGLHIDRRSYIAISRNEESVAKYMDHVSTRLQMELHFVSWHRPLETDLGDSNLFYGLQSLYSSTYWNRSFYLSDSAGLWNMAQESKLQDFLIRKDFFQLLIHPEWWLEDNAVSGFAFSYSSQFKDHIIDLRNQIRTFDELNLEQKIIDFL